MKRDIEEVCKCCPKVQNDVMNLQQELAKLEGDIRAMKPKTEPLAPPAATSVAVPPAPKTAAPGRKSLSLRSTIGSPLRKPEAKAASPARKSSNSPPQNVAPPRPKSSLPPRRNKQSRSLRQ
jgi:hypothetical protein